MPLKKRVQKFTQEKLEQLAQDKQNILPQRWPEKQRTPLTEQL